MLRQIVLVSLAGLLLPALALEEARGAEPAYMTNIQRWTATPASFGPWQRSGVALEPDWSLRLDQTTARSESDAHPAGGYHGHNFYSGGSYRVGEATSLVIFTGFGFREAIVSWNAHTPAGSWVETQLRVLSGSVWSGWYSMGVWAAGDETLERHSVDQQRDQLGRVAVDTLKVNAEPAPRAFQLRLRLFSASPEANPSFRAVGVAYSTTPQPPASLQPGNPELWDRLIDVPECSQMVYPDGGEVWCSPTSLTMVLGYWHGESGPCEPRVRATVAGVYDWLFDGHGNWPFNTAYAASQGMESFVARFSSLAMLEPWIAAGVPVIISYAWEEGELTGAAIRRSEGHLGVLVGFDAAGNPIVNDPAAASDSAVRRTYPRAELETLWLRSSGGTAYLVYPPGTPVPPM